MEQNDLIEDEKLLHFYQYQHIVSNIIPISIHYPLH